MQLQLPLSILYRYLSSEQYPSKYSLTNVFQSALNSLIVLRFDACNRCLSLCQISLQDEFDFHRLATPAKVASYGCINSTVSAETLATCEWHGSLCGRTSITRNGCNRAGDQIVMFAVFFLFDLTQLFTSVCQCDVLRFVQFVKFI